MKLLEVHIKFQKKNISKALPVLVVPKGIQVIHKFLHTQARLSFWVSPRGLRFIEKFQKNNITKAVLVPAVSICIQAILKFLQTQAILSCWVFPSLLRFV
jgi:hypothetical protein